MGIDFVIRTNNPIPMINAAIFSRENGETVIVDRETTTYSSEKTDDGNYRVGMTWIGCYIWDDGRELDPDDVLPEDECLRFVGFDLEDDAGEDYFANVEGFFIAY